MQAYTKFPNCEFIEINQTNKKYYFHSTENRRWTLEMEAGTLLNWDELNFTILHMYRRQQRN